MSYYPRMPVTTGARQAGCLRQKTEIMIKHLLLIDDDEDEHLFFQWSIERISNELYVSNAYNCEQALNILTQAKPDLIFLDIHLATEDGFKCLERLKKDAFYHSIPVYMYSTDISDCNQERALLVGASGCLKKTRSYEILAKKISEILEARQLHEV